VVGTIKLRRYAAPAAKRQKAQHFRAGGVEKTSPGPRRAPPTAPAAQKPATLTSGGSSGPLKVKERTLDNGMKRQAVGDDLAADGIGCLGGEGDSSGLRETDRLRDLDTRHQARYTHGSPEGHGPKPCPPPTESSSSPRPRARVGSKPALSGVSAGHSVARRRPGGGDGRIREASGCKRTSTRRVRTAVACDPECGLSVFFFHHSLMQGALIGSPLLADLNDGLRLEGLVTRAHSAYKNGSNDSSASVLAR
jgi:hypothetical protein